LLVGIVYKDATTSLTMYSLDSFVSMQHTMFLSTYMLPAGCSAAVLYTQLHSIAKQHCLSAVDSAMLRTCHTAESLQWPIQGIATLVVQ